MPIRSGVDASAFPPDVPTTEWAGYTQKFGLALDPTDLELERTPGGGAEMYARIARAGGLQKILSRIPMSDRSSGRPRIEVSSLVADLPVATALACILTGPSEEIHNRQTTPAAPRNRQKTSFCPAARPHTYVRLGLRSFLARAC